MELRLRFEVSCVSFTALSVNLLGKGFCWILEDVVGIEGF